MRRRHDPSDVDLPPVQDRRGVEKLLFEYLAMDDNGRELRGQVRATDDLDAVAKLRKQRLFPIEIWRSRKDAPDPAVAKQRKEVAAKNKQDAAGGGMRKGLVRKESTGNAFLARLGLGFVMKPKILAMFTRQLATMLSAGLPLLLSLRTLNEQCGKRRRYRSMRVITGDLVRKIEAGMSLSEALEFHERSFNRLYIGLVRAGEAAGALEEVLVKLAEYIEKAERLKKKIKAGMTYPVVVLVIAMSITLGLMVGVVPKFAEMFDEILEGIPLPFLTQMVIGLSDLLVHNIIIMIGVGVAGLIGLRFFFGTETGKKMFDWYIITLPPLSPLVAKIAVARF